MDDRARLEAVAKGYHELMALEAKRRATMAEMIRGCLARLKSTNTQHRAEAMKGLTDLAEMLEIMA